MISTIQIGSKQYNVSLGSRLRVEKLNEKKGALWTKGRVLAVLSDQGELTVGEPFIDKAKVKARVVSIGKAKKILVLKKKRRKGYRRTQGHRQMFTELFIEALSDAGGRWHEWEKPKAKKPQEKKAKASASPKTKKSAAAKPAAEKTTNKKRLQKKAPLKQ